MTHKIPESWFRAACELITHCVICCEPDGTFLWVNRATEELVGYSVAELKEMRWQQITLLEDVGADEANVKALLAGEVTSYTIRKVYKHKSGFQIPIIMTVWRHWASETSEIWMVCQVVRERSTCEELKTMHDNLLADMKLLKLRVEQAEERDKVLMGSHDERVSTNVNIGDRNSMRVIAVVVSAIVVIAGVVAYLAYVATWPQHQGGAQPPQIEAPRPQP